MTIDKTETVLLQMLKAGIWMKEPEVGSEYPLTDDEWREVSELATKHTVLGPVFQGMCLLPEDVMPPQELLEELVVYVDRIEKTNKIMNATVGNLLSFFRDNGLHPILMKGQGVAKMHENPLQRSCGDIDLYFDDKAEQKKALELIGGKGIKVSKMPDESYVYTWQDVEVEHHPKLLDIHNPFCRKDIRMLIGKYGFNGCLPTPLLNMLLLSAHILKHIIGPGIGLRQVADMARACYILDDKYDKGEYARLCRKWHIDVWSKELNALLEDYLGLDMKYFPVEERAETTSPYILGKILKGGNFGKYHEGEAKRNATDKKLFTIRHTVSGLKESFRLAPMESLCYPLMLGKNNLAGLFSKG